jgi:hypothetical protein
MKSAGEKSRTSATTWQGNGGGVKREHAIDRRFALHETPPVLILADPIRSNDSEACDDNTTMCPCSTSLPIPQAQTLDRLPPYTVTALEQDSSHTRKLPRSLGFQFRRLRRLEGLHKSLGTVVHATASIRVQSIPRPTGRCALHI